MHTVEYVGNITTNRGRKRA